MYTTCTVSGAIGNYIIIKSIFCVANAIAINKKKKTYFYIRTLGVIRIVYSDACLPHIMRLLLYKITHIACFPCIYNTNEIAGKEFYHLFGRAYIFRLNYRST